MEVIQIFAILTVVFNFGSCQNLGRTVTNSVKECTGAVKDYIGAQDGDDVTVHYTGWLRDGQGWTKGKKFDSSEGGQPINFKLGEGKVVKGWDDGLIGTCVGESLRLEIPSDLAYGDQEVGGGLIPANSDLIFELTLEKLEKSFRTITLEQPRKCSKNAASRNRDKVTFDYEASLPDGTVFQTSGDTDRNGNDIGPIEIGKTGIKGWDLGLTGMCKNERRRVILPPDLAYGKEGVKDGEEVIVPPNSVVILDITLHKVENRVDNFLERISSGNINFGR